MLRHRNLLPVAQHGLGLVEKAARIESHVVVRHEVVTLAGDDHVCIPVQPKFHRASCFTRQHRCSRRDERRLALLATKPAAHATALDRDVV